MWQIELKIYRFLIKLMTRKCGIMITCVTTDSEVRLCVRRVNSECPVQRQTDRHTERGRLRRKIGTEAEENEKEEEGKREGGETLNICEANMAHI